MGTVNIQLESNQCFLNFMEYLSLKIRLYKLIHTLKTHIIISYSGVTLPAILIYSNSTDLKKKAKMHEAVCGKIAIHFRFILFLHV